MVSGGAVLVDWSESFMSNGPSELPAANRLIDVLFRGFEPAPLGFIARQAYYPCVGASALIAAVSHALWLLVVFAVIAGVAASAARINRR